MEHLGANPDPKRLIPGESPKILNYLETQIRTVTHDRRRLLLSILNKLKNETKLTQTETIIYGEIVKGYTSDILLVKKKIRLSK